jgi:hypothetical protein
MDSDQMTGAVGGKAVDAQIRDMNDVRSSQATNITDYSMPSVQSSINSQTGLLRSKALPGQSQSPSFSQYGAADANDDMPMPKRKTRRVRDPYAIDLSDEDEEMEDDGEEDRKATPKANRRADRQQPQEESLADFLRNYAPPPEPPAPVKPFSIADQMANRPKKKASAPSLMARFTRRDSSTNTPPASPKTAAPPPRPDYSRNPASRAGSVSSSRHIPIQVNMPPGVDKYSPAAYGGPTASSTGSRPPASFSNSTGRVPMKRYEPREAVSVPTRSATSDLADFLRNSGPPPSSSVAQDPYPSVQSEQKNGFFGRRKKAGYA